MLLWIGKPFASHRQYSFLPWVDGVVSADEVRAESPVAIPFVGYQGRVRADHFQDFRM